MQMGIAMRGSFTMGSNMEKENSFRIMELSTMESGKMKKWMDSASYNFIMVIATRDFSREVPNRDMAS